MAKDPYANIKPVYTDKSAAYQAFADMIHAVSPNLDINKVTTQHRPFDALDFLPARSSGFSSNQQDVFNAKGVPRFDPHTGAPIIQPHGTSIGNVRGPGATPQATARDYLADIVGQSPAARNTTLNQLLKRFGQKGAGAGGDIALHQDYQVPIHKTTTGQYWGDWQGKVFGTEGKPQTTTQHIDLTRQVVDAYSKALVSSGYFTQDEAMHSLAANFTPDMKTLPDLKKLVQSSYNYVLMKKANDIGNVVDQFKKNTLDPEEQANIAKKEELYNAYLGYFSRKQAGLTGKKLGTNPLTGYTKKFWYGGLDPTAPITPQDLAQSITAQFNNQTRDEFNQFKTKLSNQGWLAPVTKAVHTYLQNKGLPKTTTSLEGLFTSGEITFKDVLAQYMQWYNSVPQEGAGVGISGSATPSPKKKSGGGVSTPNSNTPNFNAFTAAG